MHVEFVEESPNLVLARYHSPSLGRFLSVDPGFDVQYRKPQSWNLYAYVRNNPVRKTDPTGETAYVIDPNDHQQVQNDLARLAPGVTVASDGQVRNGNLFRRIWNHLTGHGRGQALVTQIINSTALIGIGVTRGTEGGSTKPTESGSLLVTYDPMGAMSSCRTARDPSRLAESWAPGALILGHELIHASRMASGTVTAEIATHQFSDGEQKYSETYFSEEFRTVGFPGATREGDVTENQLRRELDYPERGAYLPRDLWNEEEP